MNYWYSQQQQQAAAAQARAARQQAEFELQRDIFEARCGRVIDGECRRVADDPNYLEEKQP